MHVPTPPHAAYLPVCLLPSALLPPALLPTTTDCFKGLEGLVKNYLALVPLVGDLRSPAMRPRHWQALQEATKVRRWRLIGALIMALNWVGGVAVQASGRCCWVIVCTCRTACPQPFACSLPPRPCPCCSPFHPLQVHFVLDERFRLEDLLRLQLHKYAEDVAEIVDRAQKEEKMEVVSERNGCRRCGGFPCVPARLGVAPCTTLLMQRQLTFNALASMLRCCRFAACSAGAGQAARDLGQGGVRLPAPPRGDQRRRQCRSRCQGRRQGRRHGRQQQQQQQQQKRGWSWCHRQQQQR